MLGMRADGFNVLHVSGSDERAGRSLYVADLLVELAKSGVNNRLICSRDSYLYSISGIKKIDRLLMKKLSAINLCALAKEFSASLIHFHDSSSYSYIPKKRLKAKFSVSSIASTHNYDHKRTCFPFERRLRDCDALIASTVLDKNRTRDIPFDVADVHVLNKSVLGRRFNPNASPQPVLQSIGVPPEISVIATVARLDESLNYDLWLSTIAMTVEEYDYVEFLIVGDGPCKEKFENRLKEKSLYHKTLFTGFREDIPHVLAASDIYFHPTLHDTVSFSLMEAMAVGRPIIAPNLSSIRLLLENNRNGLFYQVEEPSAAFDLIAKLKTDPDLQSELARNNASDAAEKHQIEYRAKEIIEIYKRYLHG